MVKQENWKSTYSSNVIRLRDEIANAHEIARQQLEQKARRNKEIYDAKLHFTKYVLGDLVWSCHEARAVGVIEEVGRPFRGQSKAL